MIWRLMRRYSTLDITIYSFFGLTILYVIWLMVKTPPCPIPPQKRAAITDGNSARCQCKSRRWL
ncbi:hypothetical protein O3M35_001426 [Rhynocoris fuscipes]|uniref:ATP synthase F0 subunit 8 n=1 Tax=Rhynocoris fuscipes TaxID=488301 RepID=A0AAW1CMF8_9HEMI